MLDKTTVREIALKYAEEVKKVLSPEKITLFGSYVNGTPRESSDIDIAVVMNDYQDNWLDTAAMLYHTPPSTGPPCPQRIAGIG